MFRATHRSSSRAQKPAAVMAEWERSSHSVMTAAGNHKLVKPEAEFTVFELLLMSGVSLETC
jgi:hypothetical protein